MEPSTKIRGVAAEHGHNIYKCTQAEHRLLRLFRTSDDKREKTWYTESEPPRRQRGANGREGTA